jgi:flagellar biosynthetic protein FlhB
MADMDRSEAASPFKLKKAREQGQVAKSNDVISVIAFMAAISYVSWGGWNAIKKQFYFDHALLTQAGRIELDSSSFWHLANHIAEHYLLLLGPFFLVLIAAAIGGNLIQTGVIFSFDPLQPQWERINPVSGFKRIFSIKTLFDAFKVCLKMAFLVMVMYYALKDILRHQFYVFAALSPSGFVKMIVDDCVSLGMKMGLILIVIAVIDLVFTKRQFAQRMRMSKHDVKEEVKQRDGHPRIRARLRKLRREMLKRSLSVQKTSGADVLITNPTHVAVALRYVHGDMESPQLVAKGAGVLAALMRRIAAKHNIPIVQNRLLARRIFREMENDQYIPPDLYRDVARIIVWVFAMKKARSENVRNPESILSGTMP